MPMGASLPLSLPFPLRSHSSTPALPFRCSPLFLSLHTSIVCLSTQNPSGYDREEVRWLREEQRWICEEQRWLREEQRWIRERGALLGEISDLQLQIQALEPRNAQQGTVVPDTISNIAALLQVLKEKNRISESGTSARPMVFEENMRELEEEEEEKVRVSETVTKRKTLKVGSEGEEVRAMQEALLKLGFSSVEEDTEFSSFSSGTASAVKTWQEAGNGVVSTSVTQVSETIIKDESEREVEVSQQRVFLLGENRWEDPSRLNKAVATSKYTDTKTKCLICRGEGRLMCLECDGSGEPNIEPQFMEWVGEDTKCAYCEGLGYTVCDVCDGKTTQ